MKKTKRCTRCIMDDSSDKTITFDDKGQCNYCTEALQRMEREYFPGKKGERKLKELIKLLKREGKGIPYDCMMGISGGLDSSYLAYLGSKWGLRILAIHIDDGFDTEISKSNISKLCDKANIKLITIKPDAEQYNALTKAYLKAGVPNIAVPQDNILFANLYKYARKNKIKYFLSGSNFALECILQKGNTHNAYDIVNMKHIHKLFGEKSMNKLEIISDWQRDIDWLINRIETVCPLNYIDYNREKAFKELKEFCGFEYYGRKHLENILTAFAQLYWFPKKFGVDKRTSHLSSMIVSGQMTREEAMEEYSLPLYDEKQMSEYIAIVKDKLNISDKEFEEIMKAPAKQHVAYKRSLYARVRGDLLKIRRKLLDYMKSKKEQKR